MNSITFDSDKQIPVLGVYGRLTHRTVKPGTKPGLWTNQRWISESRRIDGEWGGIMRVEIKLDDEYGNGHNTFTITAAIRSRGQEIAGGCLHKEIAEVFPELTSLIEWHLVSSDGPIHYIANTVYHAKNCDLTNARISAVWPDAALEQLSDKDLLMQRLPELLNRFRTVVESIGFVWSPEEMR